MKNKTIIIDISVFKDNHAEDRREYEINAVWSVIEKAGFPVRFSDTVRAYKTAQEFVKKNRAKAFTPSMFDFANVLAEDLKLSDTAMLKKIYDILAFSALQFPPLMPERFKEGLILLKEEGCRLTMAGAGIELSGTAMRFILKNEGVYHLFDSVIFANETGLSDADLLYSKGELAIIGSDKAFRQFEAFGAQYIAVSDDFSKSAKEVI